MSNLKRIRESNELSQSALAKISGVSVCMIQKYEQGVRNINKASVSSVLALSKALKCNMEDILEKDVPND